jgi:hypothetical protein
LVTIDLSSLQEEYPSNLINLTPLIPLSSKRGRGTQGDGVVTIIKGNSELAIRTGIINQMQAEPSNNQLDFLRDR